MSGGATQRCLLYHCSVWPARCGPQVPTAMTCFLMHFSWAPLLPTSHPGPPPKCTSHSEGLISGPGDSSLTQRSYVSQPRAGDRETKSRSGGHACLSSPSPPLLPFLRILPVGKPGGSWSASQSTHRWPSDTLTWERGRGGQCSWR